MFFLRPFLKAAGLFLALCVCTVPCLCTAQTLSIDFTRLYTKELPVLTAEFSVVDEGERPIEGLSAQDVQVYIDGIQLYNFSLFPLRQAEQGLDIILLVRCSGDMRGDLFFRAKKAVRQIVERLAPNDRVALVTFNSDLRVQQDLTDEKFKINRLLHRTSLRDNSISLLQALNNTVYYWDNETLAGALIIVLAPDIQVFSTRLQQRLTERISELNIDLVGVEVSSTSPNRHFKDVFQGLGGKHISYRNENDIWSLFRIMGTDAAGKYQLIIQQAHQQDFRTHVLKMVVKMWGFVAEKDLSYIGAAGEGINPRFGRRKQLSEGFLFYFFFISIGSFLAVLGLLLSENRWIAGPVKKSWFIYATLFGAVLGLMIALMLAVMPG